MSTVTNSTKLPRVQTRMQFMDYLEEAVSMPRDDDMEPRGRPLELNAYMIESEGGFPSNFSSDGITGEVQDTGLDGIKILQVRQNGAAFEFFLDTTNPRFFVLHTNERSDDVGPIVRTLTRDRRHTFDNTWFHSDMLYNFAKKDGNVFNGFGVKYDNNTFLSDDYGGSGSAIDDLSITINGSLAQRVVDMFGREQGIKKTIAFNKVRVRRGQDLPSDFIQDDVTYDGYLSVKRGKSVQDHLHLVDMGRDMYSKTVRHVEDTSIGIKEVDGRTLVEGKSFDFEFESPIENLDLFIDRMFNSAEPFRLWGLKSNVRDGYYKITAVDLHAGTPISFDVADNLVRAYLFKGSCGNTILRMLANLQIHCDSRIKCQQVAV